MSTAKIVQTLRDHLENSDSTNVTFSTDSNKAEMKFGDLVFELESLRENPTMTFKGDNLLLTGTIIRLRQDGNIIEEDIRDEPITITINAPDMQNVLR